MAIFICFCAPKGCPPGPPRCCCPNWRSPTPRCPGNRLVAIAIDGRGEPIRLFTTNRWVTGETWYRADDVIRMLDRFQVEGAGPSAVLNRWLGAMVRLFKPEITVLLRNRDKTVMDWRWRRRSNVFEDPRLEITSSFEIDLDARLGVVEGHPGEPAPRTGARDRPGLPPMAEGWGV